MSNSYRNHAGDFISKRMIRSCRNGVELLETRTMYSVSPLELSTATVPVGEVGPAEVRQAPMEASSPAADLHAVIENLGGHAKYSQTRGWVIGGNEVLADYDSQFPYSVGLRTQDWACSGTIISQQHVLTAGHCVIGVDASQLEVSFGADLPTGSIRNNVSDIWLHPGYEDLPAVTAIDYWHAHDIALLRLSEPIPEYKAPIALMPYAQSPDSIDQMHTISGYGLTSNLADFMAGNGGADRLHSAQVSLDRFDDHSVAGPKIISFQEDGVGGCFGDSGGSLVNTSPVLLGDHYANVEQILVGVVSEGFDPDVAPDDDVFAFECFGQGSYAAYTDVGSYVPWLNITAGHNFYRDTLNELDDVRNHALPHDVESLNTDAKRVNSLADVARDWDRILRRLASVDASQVPGDVNEDGELNVLDIDLVWAGTSSSEYDPILDLNRDAQIDEADATFLVEELLKTKSGDANLDGVVSFADFLNLSFSFGKNGASWSEGDLNGDGEVTFADFLRLSANFGQQPQE